jgi:hypothetical protein
MHPVWQGLVVLGPALQSMSLLGIAMNRILMWEEGFDI